MKPKFILIDVTNNQYFFFDPEDDIKHWIKETIIDEKMPEEYRLFEVKKEKEIITTMNVVIK